MRQLLFLALTAALLGGAGPASGQRVTPAAVAEPDPYVGNAMCLRCHLGVQEKMTDTPHGEDFDMLRTTTSG